MWQARGDHGTSTTTYLPKISEGGKWMEGVLCEAKKIPVWNLSGCPDILQELLKDL